ADVRCRITPSLSGVLFFIFFFQAEDGIRDWSVTGVQTCALPISDTAIDIAGLLADRLLRVTPSKARQILELLPELYAERLAETRSEERRVGKECRYRWSPDH